jgi:type IV secretion system protein VirD4
MRTVWQFLSMRGADLAEFLAIVGESEVADGFASREALAFLNNSNEKGKDSYLMTLKTSCGAIFNSPAILDSMEETTVDFGTLAKHPASVYLVLPGKFAETHSRWFRLLLCCAFAQIEGSGLVANENKGPGVVFLLNEFFSLGRFDQIVEGMGRMRGYGVKFWTFVQTLSQLKQLYGDGWTNITGNADVVQYFGGTMDTFTADYISTLSGKTTVMGEGGSQSFRDGNETASQNETGRPVRMPDEVMRIEAGTQWISRAGQNAYPGRMIYIDKDFPEHAAFLRDLKARARPYSARYGFKGPGGGAGGGPAAPKPAAPAAPDLSYKSPGFTAFKATVGDVKP